jgi:hypothetical protein
MQPRLDVRQHLVAAPAGGLVLAVLATGQERLRSALRSVAAEPALVADLTRVVVLDAGRTPSVTVLREAVRLPAGLLRVLRRPEATRPEALARLLVDAADERAASAVLVLDDVALTDPAVLHAAFAIARTSTASDVVGLQDPAAAGSGPASWWGAVLPLDAVRALGATLPEAGDVALAELVLRAEAIGFRATVLPAAGPVPVVTEAERLLLALLHAPISARTSLLAGGFAEDLRLLLALRFGELSTRRKALSALLGSRSIAPRLVAWAAWPALRRAARDGAALRASADEWSLRLLDAEVDRAWPSGERETAEERPAGLRFSAWPTSKRGTSAA